MLLTAVQLQSIFHLNDPISDFLFMLVLDILFFLIRSKPKTEGTTIFDNNYIYSAYVKVTFLKDIISIKHMVDSFVFVLFAFPD